PAALGGAPTDTLAVQLGDGPHVAHERTLDDDAPGDAGIGPYRVEEWATVRMQRPAVHAGGRDRHDLAAGLPFAVCRRDQQARLDGQGGTGGPLEHALTEDPLQR